MLKLSLIYTIYQKLSRHKAVWMDLNLNKSASLLSSLQKKVLMCVSRYVYLFSLGYHQDSSWSPLSCFMYELVCITLPQAFHTASNWLTLGMIVTGPFDENSKLSFLFFLNGEHSFSLLDKLLCLEGHFLEFDFKEFNINLSRKIE